MRFSELPLAGAYLVELEPRFDNRGFFARCFAAEEFAAHGLATQYPHANLSRNPKRGTLRGMHYSIAPSTEVKFVRCVAGAIHDVIVDLREGSPTFGQWRHAVLTPENAHALYIPMGFAHGFLTLADNTDVLYQTGDVYRPEYERGFRWDDPRFGIEWPAAPVVMSPRDADYPDFEER